MKIIDGRGFSRAAATQKRSITDTFAIFDIFTDESGRDEHFNGQVASILKDKSAILVKNGWEQGVLTNVHHYSVLAIK